MTATETTTPCLEYRGPRQSKGYGAPTFDGVKVLLHRWVVEQTDGPLDPGEVVMHLCDNPPCFRRDHLRRATQAENMNDAVRKGRHRFTAHRGESNGTAKLSAEQVQEIRRLHAVGWTQQAIADAIGIVGRTQVGNIVRGSMWR